MDSVGEGEGGEIWGNGIETWYYTCFNAILPNLPTLSLSHRVHKTDLYISVLLNLLKHIL